MDESQKNRSTLSRFWSVLNSSWSTWPPVGVLRTKSRFFDNVVETVLRYSRHNSGRNAAVLSFYGFLTLFPLFLVGTTVLGFVLEGRPDLRDDILSSAVSEIPILGSQIESQSGSLTGSSFAFISGLLLALWGSTRAFNGLQTALDDAWEVPQNRRPNLVIRRLRSLLGVLLVGAAQVGTVISVAAAQTADLALVEDILLLSGTLLVNSFVLGCMFKSLSSLSPRWLNIYEGALFGGLLFTVFQVFGTKVMSYIFSRAEPVYGAFASVFAITAWLSIHATISLFASEWNAHRFEKASSSIDALKGPTL